MRLNRARPRKSNPSVPRRVRSTWANICDCAGPGAGPRRGTLAGNCVADDRHQRPLADRGSPGRTHGNAVTNPRIRVCSTVVLTALPPAPRTRSILLKPVPDNRMANPRPTSLTTNIRISARELVVEPRVRLLPRHRRSLLRRVEPPHRPTLAHHVHRPPGLGQCMMISAGWY